MPADVTCHAYCHVATPAPLYAPRRAMPRCLLLFMLPLMMPCCFFADADYADFTLTALRLRCYAMLPLHADAAAPLFDMLTLYAIDAFAAASAIQRRLMLPLMPCFHYAFDADAAATLLLDVDFRLFSI